MFKKKFSPPVFEGAVQETAQRHVSKNRVRGLWTPWAEQEQGSGMQYRKAGISHRAPLD